MADDLISFPATISMVRGLEPDQIRVVNDQLPRIRAVIAARVTTLDAWLEAALT